MRWTVFLVLPSIWLSNVTSLSGPKNENSRLNYFDTDLLRYSAENRRGNVMISPASVKSTLAMILEGSEGATAAEIKSALRLSPNKEEFREQLNLYLTMLQSNASGGGTLQNANAVFVSNKLRLKKEYEIMLRKVYLSEVYSMDLRDSVPAAAQVNNWINNVTKGLIPSIIEPVHIDPATQIILTNALYFKQTWKHSFDPRQTHGACFHVNNICRNVAMMELHAELRYTYVENLRAHAVELPYEGNRYSMIILVPQDKDGVVALVRDLPYMSLPQIIALLEPADVTLSLPKFTIDYSDDMVGPLKAMRITTVFSSAANLSGMFERESPQINNMLHKVHMSVDEEGTVAAAATSAMVIPLIENGVQLSVDRPFVFFLRDNNVGLTLFAGKIEEPTSFVAHNGVGQSPKKANGPSTNKKSSRYF